MFAHTYPEGALWYVHSTVGYDDGVLDRLLGQVLTAVRAISVVFHLYVDPLT